MFHIPNNHCSWIVLKASCFMVNFHFYPFCPMFFAILTDRSLSLRLHRARRCRRRCVGRIGKDLGVEHRLRDVDGRNSENGKSPTKHSGFSPGWWLSHPSEKIWVRQWEGLCNILWKINIMDLVETNLSTPICQDLCEHLQGIIST